ncbi:MAG: universal stress protein [Acidimicrobiia bacterium]|nr:universal stress protein [Acidimicrobiia bacterium]
MSTRCFVLATDGSAGALGAAAWLAPLAVAVDAEVVAVHAYDRLAEVVESDQRLDFPELQAAAEERLAGPWVEPLRAAGVTVRTVLTEGRATQVVSDAVAAHSAELVVVGSYGASGWKARFVGSTARALVDLAAFPVLVVPRPS